MIVPEANAAEAALAAGVEVLGVGTLGRLVDLLHGRWEPEPARAAPRVRPGRPGGPRPRRRPRPGGRQARARDRRGGRAQPADGRARRERARRWSPAGCPGILPPPSFEEALEITRIHSVAGIGRRRARPRSGRSARPTTRSPRRAWSAAAPGPGPGEMTLAHRGVLFLDELAEFSRAALEALRQPLEDGRGRDRRAASARSRFPRARCWSPRATRARAARPAASARCSEIDRRALPAPSQRAAARPDRPRLSRVRSAGGGARRARRRGRRASAAIAARVMAARERQRARLAGSGALCNGEMDGRLTRRHVRSGGGGERLLGSVARRRPHRPRARPGAAAGAHDRRPRRARRGVATRTSTRRSATGSPRRRRWRRERRRVRAPACGAATWSASWRRISRACSTGAARIRRGPGCAGCWRSTTRI